ncbi:MAG: hypothetical protein GX221_10245 [Candidatus Riflebacteria bacterium]|nr:hypothetical protein [Candidatus Riflebacteria bacterium]
MKAYRKLLDFGKGKKTLNTNSKQFNYPFATGRSSLAVRLSRPPLPAKSFFSFGRKAFTMVEAVAVLVLVAIVATTVLPAVDSFNSTEYAKADASKFINLVRLMRYTAIEDKTSIKLTLTFSNKSFLNIELSDPNSEYKIEDFLDDPYFYGDFTVDDARDYDKFIITFSKNGELELNLDLNNTTPYGSLPSSTLLFNYGNSTITAQITKYGILSSDLISEPSN